MKYLVVKVKGQDLFYSCHDSLGEYVCSTPMLLDKEQADSIMMYCIEVYHLDSEEVFTNDQLEIKEVQLNYV